MARQKAVNTGNTPFSHQTILNKTCVSSNAYPVGITNGQLGLLMR